MKMKRILIKPLGVFLALVFVFSGQTPVLADGTDASCPFLPPAGRTIVTFLSTKILNGGRAEKEKHADCKDDYHNGDSNGVFIFHIRKQK